MQKLDNEFFEAYKHLDRLCSDIYSCRNGVSQYINDLEQVSSHDQLAVPMVKQWLKILKHLRWVRNQIAHDPEEFQICEECDIQRINDFYNDILEGNDPLTKLREYHETCISAKKEVFLAKPKITRSASSAGRHIKSSRHNGYWGMVFLIFASVPALLVYLLLRSI